MHTNEIDNQKPREGIIFWGAAEDLRTVYPFTGVSGPRFVMGLYIEGQQYPIYRRYNRFFENLDSTNVDLTFQQYVAEEAQRRNWRFRQVEDQTKRSVLLTYAKEKAQGKRGEQLIYRFLEANQNELAGIDCDPRLVFILTSDRSDLERERLRREYEEIQKQLKLQQDRIRYGRFFEDIEIPPLNDAEELIIEKIKQIPVIHIFNRGVFHGYSVVDTDVIAFYEDYKKGWRSQRPLTVEEKALVIGRDYLSKMLTAEDLDVIEHSHFSPTINNMTGGYFLGLLVRSGLVAREEINELFQEVPNEWFKQFGEVPQFDILKWSALAKGRNVWPSFDGAGKSMSALAKILKKGIQRYAWDGRYGDISESWKTVYIDPEGNIWHEDVQTYGGMFI